MNPIYLNTVPKNVLAVFQIGLFPNQNLKNREVYNLFDWFSDIGGIQEVIFVLASGFSGIFSSTLVSIQKAELIYKFLPYGRRGQEMDKKFYSVDK